MRKTSRDRAHSLITAVRAYWLQYPLPEPLMQFQSREDRRDAVVVQVIAADGTEGWGDCSGPPEILLPAIKSLYAPLLLGKDAQTFGALWDQLFQATYRWGRRGAMLGALSGLDIALWDLAGKQSGRSVSDMLGGKQRDRLPCYATGMHFRDVPEAELAPGLVDEAHGYLDAGFRAVKAQIGRNPVFDVSLIRSLRTNLPNATLIADANCAYDLPEALFVGRALEDAGFAWMEDPLSLESPEQYAVLGQRLPRLPLASGEWEQTRWGFQNLLSGGGVLLPQIRLTYCGGLTEAQRIRNVTGSMGLNLLPLATLTPFGVAAAVHFLASDARRPGRAEPSPGILGVLGGPEPLRDNLCGDGVTIESGMAKVPTGPGLGVTVDLDSLRFFTIHTEEITQ